MEAYNSKVCDREYDTVSPIAPLFLFHDIRERQRSYTCENAELHTTLLTLSASRFSR